MIEFESLSMSIETLTALIWDDIMDTLQNFPLKLCLHEHLLHKHLPFPEQILFSLMQFLVSNEQSHFSPLHPDGHEKLSNSQCLPKIDPFEVLLHLQAPQ